MKAIKKLIFSFGYAFRGLVFCIKTCRNFRIHTVAAALVLWGAQFYDFNKTEYAVILAVIALVITAEALNTALEQACDVKISDNIKHAKDSAAAAVLCSSVFAVLIAAVMLVDLNAFRNIYTFFASSPLNVLFLVIGIIIAVIYIFYEDIFRHGKQ